jgi:hypothetical protein
MNRLSYLLLLGVLAGCGGKPRAPMAPPVPPTPTASAVGPSAGSGLFFDDFDYAGADDPRLAARHWTVRSEAGGPGVAGATWCCVSFVDDPERAGNRLLQLEASAGGSNTKQSEIEQSRRFHEGTYAARVFFSDAPVSGPDGDQVVEAFFTITPLAFDLDLDYGETDFEYLPNGGWGVTGSSLYMTTWETYQNDPWKADNVSERLSQSTAGWHDLVIQVAGGVAQGTVTYYLDGVRKASHPARYYPETPLNVNFNLWFVNGGLVTGAGPRTYVQQVDYFYYAGREVLDPAAVTARVRAYRESGTRFVDTVPVLATIP